MLDEDSYISDLLKSQVDGASFPSRERPRMDATSKWSGSNHAPMKNESIGTCLPVVEEFVEKLQIRSDVSHWQHEHPENPVIQCISFDSLSHASKPRKDNWM